MKYIVFDLEFNQPPSKDRMLLEPTIFYAEIIQIGAVKVDEKFKIIDTFDVLVSPKYYSRISAKVKRVISQNHVDSNVGMPFVAACRAFFDFCGDDFCLFSWGPSDMDILKKNMIMHGITTANFPHAYDVQSFYSSEFEKNQKQIALKDAVKRLGKPQYVAHNALNDAFSTAEILSHLTIGVDKSNGVVILKPSEGFRQKVVIRGTFSSKDDALKKLETSDLMCECGKRISIEGLFVLSKSKAIATSICSCGNEYFIVAKFSQTADQKIKLTCYKEPMSQGLKDFYLKQKNIDDAIKQYAMKHKHR